jgi:UPF0755 protein
MAMKKYLNLLLLIIAMLVFTGCVSEQDFTAVDPSATDAVIIEIPSGSTAKSIGALLESEGLIRSADAFVKKVKDMDAAAALQAGQYQFSKAMSVEEVVKVVSGGEVYRNTFKVVVPEGFEVVQIAERLSADGHIDKDLFYKELRTGDFDYKFLSPEDRDTNLEGFLFPATYTFDVGTSEHDIIDAMLKKFDEVFKAEYYTQAESLGLTVREVITMASIVEREARVHDERPIVAGVFYNRIQTKMALQSCATVQYILGERKEVLSNADIAIDNPYNTYKYPGLPPAPIASPGELSIKAALYPADTEYFYFVTTNLGDGSHYFSKTYDEHLQAIERSKQN